MNNHGIKYQTKTASTEEIYLHLKECNDSFIPPLNQKVDLKEYARKIAEKAITFEAWADTTLVGLVAVYFNDFKNRVGYITNVSVVNDHKGKKIAYDLINNSIEYAKQFNFHQIELEVSPDNQQAIQLYKKFKFDVFENTNNLIRMKLKINDLNLS